MAAGTVAALNAAEFQRLRTFVGIIRHITVPSGAAGLNPTAIIWVGGSCGNLCAILQRDWGDACMRQGEPDRALILFSRFTNRELNSPGILADSFHQRLALEMLFICRWMALTRGQQQTREDQ